MEATVKIKSGKSPPQALSDGWSFAGEISTDVEPPSYSSSTASSFRLDGLVRLARLRNSPMDFLVVAVELVLASETLLVVFADEDGAFEAFGVDAVLGRGMAH